MNSTVFSSMIATVKSEPDCISDQIEQKVKYEQEIIQLRKMYDEQIYKLRNELEKSKQSSLLLHSDLSRQDEFSSNENLKTKNMELMVENTRLKKDLSIVTNKYQGLVNEMQDVRQYILKMIANLD